MSIFSEYIYEEEEESLKADELAVAPFSKEFHNLTNKLQRETGVEEHGFAGLSEWWVSTDGDLYRANSVDFIVKNSCKNMSWSLKPNSMKFILD